LSIKFKLLLNNMRRLSVYIIVATLFISGTLSQKAFAETTQEILTRETQAQIQIIQQKITTLRSQLTELKEAQNRIITDEISVLTRHLGVGATGRDVENLQRFLRQFPKIYPEGLVTGHFGQLTRRAVTRFQQENNIRATGFVGPLTLNRINYLLIEMHARPKITSLELHTVPETQELAPSIAPPDTDRNLPRTPSQFALLPRPNYDFNTLALSVHNLVNQKRREAGLNEIMWDEAIARIAIEHGLDQARDNTETTNPDLLCQYPLIRHEGFSFGFTLGDRLRARSAIFRSAAENLAIMPLTKNLIFQHPRDNPPPPCPVVDAIKPINDSQEAKTSAHRETLRLNLKAIQGLQPINWVNREWKTADKLAKSAVEGWMNSEGHRRNILTPALNFGGVGIVEVNNHIILVHKFVGR